MPKNRHISYIISYRRDTRFWEIPPLSIVHRRADFALPLNGDAGRRFTIKITNADRTQFSFKEARDVEVGRELTVPSSIFAWP